MPAVLKALDVLVLCSRQGFGRVVAEMMAAGTPVVASCEGTLAELIQDGRQGYLATPGEAGDFAPRVTTLSTMGLRARMGRAGQPRAGAFAAPIVAPDLREVYGALSTPAPEATRADEPAP